MATSVPQYMPLAALHTSKTASFVSARTSAVRPVSTASDDHDTDFEDDSDVEDGDSGKSSFDERRKSATTISSYDEVPTPGSQRSGERRRPFDLDLKSIEGPRGPHLFRSSSASGDFDYALQLSPLFPKDQPRRPGTSFTEETVTPTTKQRHEDFSIASALAAPELDRRDAQAQIRQWNPAQVVDWMVSSGMDETTIDCFEDNDINGSVLMDLQFDHLRDQLGIQSFGKRHQLWTAICTLRGEQAVFSPTGTPFQDTSRPATTIERSSSRSALSTEFCGTVTPIEHPGTKKRRGRKAPKVNDIVTPAESVSIVAIEQLVPKPHSCAKGENCAKWRKQQRELKRLQEEDGFGRFPISPTNGGRIYISGDPGNANTATNIIPNCRRQADDTARHTVDTVPSMIASSGLLSPGQLPEFALHENMLGQLGNRDPQDNVRQFLNFQHVNSPTESPSDLEQPPFIPRSTSVPPMFPANHHQAYPSLVPPRTSATPGPRDGLRQLPRLEIPRSQSTAPETALASPGRSALSPSMVYRLGSPQSEMDVPVTAIHLGPVSRDMSQSVPANMQFRQPQSPLGRPSLSRSTTGDLRRPSVLPLPAVHESEELMPASSDSQSQGTAPRSSQDSNSTSNTSPSKSGLERPKLNQDPKLGEPVVRHFSYGENCSYAGYMKKRKTKLLRHEWQDGHFRLNGSQLSMHENARLASAPLEKINVEKYDVACSTAVSSGKLSAAMKAFHIKSQSATSGSEAAKADDTAFNFQLVPSKEGEKKAAVTGKTHHFAVKSKDDRIDWMRELMLAKALQQKGKGYNVEINGEKF